MAKIFLELGGRVAVAAINLVLASLPAFAGNCLSKAESFELNSEVVHWGFAIHSGSECLQGLRGKSMLIDAVTIIEPPKAGSVTISGPAFFYRAPAAASNDRFRLRIIGENNRMRGTSEIIVDVSVR